MDSHYTNNFNNTFQNIIPNYNPGVEQHHETKDFPPAQQQAHPDSGQHFNVLMSNVMYHQPVVSSTGFNTMHDNNNLYSDLDGIDETPQLIDNNMTSMDLYDTDPLDNGMITNHNQNIFQPQSTISNQQNIFNSYEEPKLNHFNTNHVNVPPMQDMSTIQQVSNPVQSHPSIIQSNINTSVISHSNVIQSNPNSIIQTSLPQHTIPSANLMDPIPTSSFYQSNYNPAPTITPTEPSKPTEEQQGNVVVNQTEAPVEESSSVEAAAKPNENVENNEAMQTNGVAHEEPTSTKSQSNETNGNAVAEGTDNSKGGDETMDGGKGELEKCVRQGCDNIAVVNTEWEDEYCSNECCIKHCTSVFNAWVQENLKATAQNEGNTVM
ncbi:hypothetical protein M8J77_016931 [Diaphorina citri]|nr:hypothetical protein M8J77_016931 [Diaphorina citri]